MESAALAQGLFSKNKPFIGAPQELVSCDKKSGDNGCNGGLPANAFKYLSTTPLEPETDYPYKSGTTKVRVRVGVHRGHSIHTVDTQSKGVRSSHRLDTQS